jgi:transmembrane sensor
MNPQYLLTLLEKYQAGTCTEEELQQLENWYASLGTDRPDEILHPQEEATRLLMQQQLQVLKSRLATPERRIFPYKPMLRWAAVIFMIAGAWYFFQPERQQARVVAEKKEGNRYLILPDSSRVLLHEGSQLSYPQVFKGNTREVTLKGEAYFDIRENSHSAFIITTGKIKTTVLGTAFNIKATDDKVIVSVTKGKVKVAEGERVLAILTSDHEVVYNVPRAIAEKKTVDAVAQASWIQQDMVFESVTMETIAATISKRYHVNIEFKTKALKDCLVRASFTGMEPLEEVLNVICMVRNASYVIENNQNVIIDGQPCL